MKNNIYIMEFLDKFPYNNNFDLKNFFLNMITEDFSH